MDKLSGSTNINFFSGANVQNTSEHLDSDVEMTPVESSETISATPGGINSDWYSSKWRSNNWEYKTWNHNSDWHSSKNENHTASSNTHTNNRTEDDDIEMSSSSGNTWNDWNNWSDWSNWKHSDWDKSKWNGSNWSEKEGEKVTIHEENFPPNPSK